MDDQLTPEERCLLLVLARQALKAAVCWERLPALDLKALPERLFESGASFVTLRKLGELRGCIGTLEPYQSLAEDVREHAVAAALQDYRFPPVQPEELPLIEIEISRLTLPRPLPYDCPEDILFKLRPGVDGVFLRDGLQRATFLPQVWEWIPEPAAFLGRLCQKMGVASDLWRIKKLELFVYEVEEFREGKS